MREIRTLRSTWRGWKRGAVETLRPQPARQSSTLPSSSNRGVTIARYEALYGTVFLLQIHAVYMEGLRKAGLPEG